VAACEGNQIERADLDLLQPMIMVGVAAVRELFSPPAQPQVISVELGPFSAV
jgi:hypothetical protein